MDRRLAVGLGAVAAAVIVAIAFWWRPVVPAPTATSITASESERPSASAPPSADPLIAGTIEVVVSDIAPNSLRGFGSSAVWSGSELLVWGRDSGVCPATGGTRYSAATGFWARMSAAPIDPDESQLIWTGREMLVAGIDTRNKTCRYNGSRAVGAAYDPTQDAWRRIAEPRFINPSAAVSIWAGDRWVIGSGIAFAAYNPPLDRWRRLPSLQGNVAYPPTMLWTGNDLVHVSLWGTYRLAGDADAWATIPSGYGVGTAVWAGDRAIGIGLFNELVEWAPGDAEWRAPIQPTPRDADDPLADTIDLRREIQLLWTGDLVLLLDQGRAFEPATGRWFDLEPPDALATWAQAYWAGDRILAMVERGDDGSQQWQAFVLRR